MASVHVLNCICKCDNLYTAVFCASYIYTYGKNPIIIFYSWFDISVVSSLAFYKVLFVWWYWYEVHSLFEIHASFSALMNFTATIWVELSIIAKFSSILVIGKKSIYIHH